MKIKLFLIIVLSIMPPVISAQQDTKHYIGSSCGLNNFHIKDERASSLIFSNSGFIADMQYFYNGETNKHKLEASYFTNSLFSISDNYQTENTQVKIRYSYFQSVTDFTLYKMNFQVFAGGALSTYLCYSDYYFKWFNSSLATANESWYWSNSLDVSALLIHNVSDREFFALQITIPVISNISRPKYSPTADYNYIENDWKFKMFGETEFFPDNFALNTILSYQHPLFWKFNFQLSYEFYYSIYSKPKEVSMYTSNFNAGLFFCL